MFSIKQDIAKSFSLALVMEIEKTNQLVKLTWSINEKPQYLLIFFCFPLSFKDTHRENSPSNKLKRLRKV